MSYMNEEKALVTGGAGFVGTHLVRALTARGKRVVVADYQPPNINSPLRVLGLASSVEYVEIDLSDQQAVERNLRGEFSTIFHLAGQPIGPRSQVEPERTMACNVNSTNIMIEFVQRGQARQLILASSACAFGVPDLKNCPLSENHTFARGIYPYTESKQQAEALLHKSGIRSAVARFVNLFGEADWHMSRIVPRIARQLVLNEPLSLSRSNGESVLDFLHVSDAVTALLSLETYLDRLSSWSELPSIFHFGYGLPISVLELIHLMCIKFDGAARLVAVPHAILEAPMHKYLDSANAKRQLGWRPLAPRDGALRQTIEWYASHVAKLHDIDGRPHFDTQAPVSGNTLGFLEPVL